MAIKITEDCINCGACEAECPNNAIYEPDQYWRLSDGTSLTDSVERNDDGFSDEFFYIVTSKCTECIGFHDEPQCAAVCPVDCCIKDENNIETEEQLLIKKENMHLLKITLLKIFLDDRDFATKKLTSLKIWLILKMLLIFG